MTETDLRSEAEAMVADLRIDKESEVVQGVADIITKLLSAWGEAVASGSLAAAAMIEQTRIIDNLRAELAKVTAERDDKRPFSDALAQRIIDQQVKEIDLLRALVQALRSGDAELRRQIAELGEKMLRLGGNHD